MLYRLIPNLTREQWGVLFMYLIPFVPYIYKLISPFFILLGLGSLTVMINPILLWVGIFWARHRIIKQIRHYDVCLYLFICLIVLLSPLLFPNTSDFFLENFIDFAIYVLPCYFIGIIINYDNDYEILKMVSYIGIGVILFWQLCKILRLVEVEESSAGTLGEQMSEAYMLVFPICCLFVLIKKCKLDYIILSVGITLLIMMGTRGPIIVVSSFIAFYLLFRKNEKYGTLIKLFAITVFVTLLKNIKLISILMIPIVAELGFSTRVLDSITDDRFSLEESSGRDDIYSGIFNFLYSQESLFGLGWGGDRLIVMDNVWAHNFELEILVQFGWFFGGLILCWILKLLISSLVRTRGTQSYRFVLVMACVGLLELQFSSTYIRHPLFFIMIGYFISISRKKNNI